MSGIRAAITGSGISQLGRNLHKPAILLLAEAARNALDRAGLTMADIDGISTYPGKADRSPGMSPLGTGEVRNALGIKTRWHSAVPDGPAQSAPIMTAAMAVSTGQARHVLCFRALTESSSQTAGRRASVSGSGGGRMDGWLSWLVAAGAMSASNWAGWHAQRYFHEFGMTREHLGMIATGQRRFAQMNPAAVMQKPLSMEEYLAARMISSPLGLFDCDIPIDGACAVIVSAEDAAKDCASTPLAIEAMGTALSSQETWDQRPDLTTMGSHDSGADLWQRTDFRPADLDVLGLYDGFSIFVPLWLEALGLCGHGEAKDFIAEGNIGPGGRYPVNTGGGQMSGGRLHGFGLLHEVCQQLWHDAGERQVADAKLGVVAMGGGFIAGSMLLRRG